MKSSRVVSLGRKGDGLMGELENGDTDGITADEDRPA